MYCSMITCVLKMKDEDLWAVLTGRGLNWAHKNHLQQHIVSRHQAVDRQVDQHCIDEYVC